MQTLRFILFSFITLTTFSNAQTVIPPGNVSGTWTWGGSPYEINGEITIPNDSTLTIEPGVLVEFQGHYKFNVQGRLLAVGTKTDTTVFTINDTTGFHDPSIPDGGWHGIRFNPSLFADSSKLIYCKLQYGKAVAPFWPDNSGGAIYVEGFDKLLISNSLIKNNKAGGMDYPRGGGISIYNNSSIAILNSTISGNSSLTSGGGIQVADDCNVTISNCIISENSAENGGGIMIPGNSTPSITNSMIMNNYANQAGGGMCCWDNGNPIIDNVTFIANVAGNKGGAISSYRGNLQIEASSFINNEALNWRGGGINAGNCDLEIDNCSFVENEAPNGGGGAIGYSNNTNINYELSISNSDFIGNQAQSDGGGVSIKQFNDSTITTIFIDKCEFTGNSADYHSGLKIRGNISGLKISNCVFTGNEAIRYTAALSFTRKVTGEVYNCLFASNIANTGGGGWNAGGVGVWTGSNVDFMNCTFADNSAYYGTGLTVGGGGIATTTNCIFWGNSTDQIALDTLYGEGGTLTVNYCDVQDGEDSVKVIDPLLSTLNWEDGNIDVNPIFENPLISDYHLQDTSPCIGAAIDTIEINGIMCYCPPFDIEGNPRPYPVGTMPDMGAYEYQFLVGIEENLAVHPTDYTLYQNYPNPFNPSTKLKYQIPELSFVTIKVYNVLGNVIETLVDEAKSVGTYKIEFNASTLPSGVYFYRLQAVPTGRQAGSFVETKKMVLMK